MVEHIESDDGLTHVFRAKTKKTFEQFKKDANLELKGSWASFVISSELRDRVFYIASLGAHGTGKLENDTIVMTINLESWPATWGWVKEKIVHDVLRMTEALSAYSNLQAEEFESRARIRKAADAKLAECRERETEATRTLARWEILDDVTRVLIAVTGTGSAFAAWFGGLQAGVLYYAAVSVATSVGVLGTTQAVLKASDQIKHWSELKGHFVRLKNDLESFINDIDFRPDFQIADFQQRFQGYERRYADGEVLWRTDILAWFWSNTARVRPSASSSSAQSESAVLDLGPERSRPPAAAGATTQFAPGPQATQPTQMLHA